MSEMTPETLRQLAVHNAWAQMPWADAFLEVKAHADAWEAGRLQATIVRREALDYQQRAKADLDYLQARIEALEKECEGLRQMYEEQTALSRFEIDAMLADYVAALAEEEKP